VSVKWIEAIDGPSCIKTQIFLLLLLLLLLLLALLSQWSSNISYNVKIL